MRFMFFGVLALIAGFFSIKIINETSAEIKAIKRDGIVTQALPITGYTESKGRRSGTTYHIDLKYKTKAGGTGAKRIAVTRATLDRFAANSPVEVMYLEKNPSEAIILGDDSTEVGFLLQLFGYGFFFGGIYMIGRGYIDWKEDDSEPGSDVADFEALANGRFYAGIGLAIALATLLATAMQGKGVALGILLLLCIVGTMVFGAMANSRVNAGYGTDGMTTPIALILLFFPLVALLPLAYLFLRPTVSLRHAKKFGMATLPAAPSPAAASSSRTQTINRTASGGASSGATKADQARMLIARALPQIKNALPQPMTNGEILTVAMEVEGVKIPQDDLPIVRVACKSLAITYVVDNGKGVSYINPKQLRDSGLTAEQLHAAAIENLTRLTKNQQKGLAVLPQEDFSGVMLDGKSEASLLLIDALWDSEFKSDTRNGVVVAIPARDMLAFCDQRSTAGIAALRELTQRVAPAASKALTKQLYYRIDGDWMRYE
jgi:hypothetical protein